MLAGKHTYRIYVGTGSVPPMTGDQAGYEVQADLVLTPGKPAREAFAVATLFFTHAYNSTTSAQRHP